MVQCEYSGHWPLPPQYLSSWYKSPQPLPRVILDLRPCCGSLVPWCKALTPACGMETDTGVELLTLYKDSRGLSQKHSSLAQNEGQGLEGKASRGAFEVRGRCGALKYLVRVAGKFLPGYLPQGNGLVLSQEGAMCVSVVTCSVSKERPSLGFSKELGARDPSCGLSIPIHSFARENRLTSPWE